MVYNRTGFMNKSRIIGLDIGEARTGVAVSIPGTSFAAPLGTAVARTAPEIAAEIKRLVDFAMKEGRIEGETVFALIVAGLPLAQGGEDSPASLKVRKIAEEVGRELSLAVRFVDERYTTRKMQSADRESGRSAKKGKENIDARAAAEILESYLSASGFSGREIENV